MAASIPQVNIPTPSYSEQGAAGAVPTGEELGSYAPLPYQDFGNIPYINPAYNNLQAMPGALQGYESDIYQGLQPEFQSQDMALTDSLAGRGITDTGAATDLSQNLQTQQGQTVAAADAPMIQAMAGYYNQDQLANQQAANQASEYNATAYGTVAAGNEANYNNYLNTMESQGSQYGNSLLEGYLGSYGGPNSTILGTMGNAPGQIGQAYEYGYGSAAQSPWATALGQAGSLFNNNTNTNNTNNNSNLGGDLPSGDY
jgi:hypothetical protein